MTFRRFLIALVIAIGIAVGSIALLIIVAIIAAGGGSSSPQVAQQKPTRTEGARAHTPSRESAPAASGTSPSSGLTYANYLRLKNGMSYREVVGILGREGEEMSRSELVGITTVAYTWKRWNGANIIVMFQDGGLITKAQAGLD